MHEMRFTAFLDYAGPGQVPANLLRKEKRCKARSNCAQPLLTLLP